MAATRTKKTTPESDENTARVSPEDFSSAWGGEPAEVLSGYDLVDKATLIEQPFMITSVRFETNKRDIGYVYVDAMLRNGDLVSFNDSSTGVRAQVVRYLADKGLDAAVDTGEPVPCRLVAPKGLRVSQFEVVDARGAKKQAKTYYLTTGGQRS